MKTLNFRNLLLLCLLVLIGAFLPRLQAQECTVLLPETNKSGTVHPAKNAVIDYKPQRTARGIDYDRTIVRVRKTGGMASGEVKIYADNQLKYTIPFQNGNSPTPWIERSLDGVGPGAVRVTVNNQSVGYFLKYSCHFQVVYSQLFGPAGYAELEVAPNMGEQIISTHSTACSRKVKVSISKVRGTYGKGTAYIYDGTDITRSPIATYNIPEQRGVAQEMDLTIPSGKMTIKVVNTHPSTPLKVRARAFVR